MNPSQPGERAGHDRLAAANLAIREAVARFELEDDRRHQARRGVQAIDSVLEVVEQQHLAGRSRDITLFPAWRACLEEAGDLSIPLCILELKHTVRPHEALMDRQDARLNDAMPGPATLAQADDAWAA